MEDPWLKGGSEIVGDLAEGCRVDYDGEDSGEGEEGVSPERWVGECSGGVDAEAFQHVVCEEGPH